MSTTVSMTKFNFMDIADFNAIENHDNTQVCAVDIDTNIELHNKIVTWGIPDNVNAITFTFTNNVYVAPDFGFLKVLASTAACTIAVNGVNCISYAATYNNTSLFYYPVQKDDVITLVSGSATTYTFVPMLGNTPTTDPS